MKIWAWSHLLLPHCCLHPLDRTFIFLHELFKKNCVTETIANSVAYHSLVKPFIFTSELCFCAAFLYYV